MRAVSSPQALSRSMCSHGWPGPTELCILSRIRRPHNPHPHLSHSIWRIPFRPVPSAPPIPNRCPPACSTVLLLRHCLSPNSPPLPYAAVLWCSQAWMRRIVVLPILATACASWSRVTSPWQMPNGRTPLQSTPVGNLVIVGAVIEGAAIAGAVIVGAVIVGAAIAGDVIEGAATLRRQCRVCRSLICVLSPQLLEYAFDWFLGWPTWLWKAKA